MKLFVYGTLVKGGTLSNHMQGCSYLGDCTLKDHALYMVCDWYPGLVEEAGQITLGELYEVPDEKIGHIDAVEGSQYRRINVRVRNTVNNEEMECQTYLYIHDHSSLIRVKENIWHEKRVRVFGYGSLMLSSELKRTLKSDYIKTTKLPIGTLRGYRLIYDYYSSTRGGGALDLIEGSEDDYVLGTVTEMPYSAMEKIDKREGHPNTYRRTKLLAKSGEEKIDVYCYIVVDEKRKKEQVPPTEEYNRIVIDGMRENGLPEEYVDGYLGMK